MGLIRWVGDREEPCDYCWKFVRKDGGWVAYWQPYAPHGVRFLCRECYDKQLAWAQAEREKILAEERRVHDAGVGGHDLGREDLVQQ